MVSCVSSGLGHVDNMAHTKRTTHDALGDGDGETLDVFAERAVQVLGRVVIRKN